MRGGGADGLVAVVDAVDLAAVGGRAHAHRPVGLCPVGLGSAPRPRVHNLRSVKVTGCIRVLRDRHSRVIQ